MTLTKFEAFIKKWHKRFIQICLDDEIYPNDEIPKDFLIVTKQELKDLGQKTDRRVKRYNKTKPKGLATYC